MENEVHECVFCGRERLGCSPETWRGLAVAVCADCYAMMAEELQETTEVEG
jgi:transcription elongation factor Elf1